ncbi:hypothetical protein HA402_014178 [Bradysia odoriphaga]|nr:hypothetical protein HA402_014178 [Bradysia odoriphaga]
MISTLATTPVWIFLAWAAFVFLCSPILFIISVCLPEIPLMIMRRMCYVPIDTVIEGYLMIILIDRGVNESSFEGLEFPLLTEVTEYVLLYRVYGLTSLGKLFPNLRVIRGNYVSNNYALIVYEMIHLQEIGLKSLTEISRGNVRIEKNPMLCFADTVEWSLITSSSKNNIIRDNRATNDCPTCPGVVCWNKDIRNSVDELNQLKNCSVIEGYLIITLIDRGVNESSFEGLEFPLLTEVTEYVLLYRVHGLTSLGKLFPNLRVIRGNYVVDNYALIVYEMIHLQEIGLKSLTEISRGNVRIENNPMLCFADTIEWSLITSSSKTNIIRDNRATNDCPTCPGVGKSTSDTSSLLCPELNGKNLCWNQFHCQELCPSKCGNSTCNVNGGCCDDSCVGCDETGKCLSCRHLSSGNSKDLQCVKSCPANMFSYKNYRCITESECRAIEQPMYVEAYDEYLLLEYPYIPRDGECSTVCPSNFHPDKLLGHRKCIPCVGTCNKLCRPGVINSLSKAQDYRGCTHISGSLMINIRNQSDPNTVRELEKSLSEIEVIEGNLIIKRSYPLVSLGFFKKLRLVRNNPIGKEKYGIKVIGNQNLRALFPHNVTVEHGRMFFHFNPKLCANVIDEFKFDVIDLRSESSLTDDEVASDTNGDKTSCNMKELNVEINRINCDTVVIQFEPLFYDDYRSLLGYLMYYRSASFQNVTMFDGSDACGGDGWQVKEILVRDRRSPILFNLTHLQPDTQYAYYIRTWTIDSEEHGGLTVVKYFTTRPKQPGTTRGSVNADDSSEINNSVDPSVQSRERSSFAEDWIQFENEVLNTIFVRKGVVIVGAKY